MHRICLLLLGVLVSCDNAGNEGCGSGGFCNITQCPGNQTDQDDWQPLYIGSTDTIGLGPTCPNPTSGITRFGFSLPRRDSLVISLNDRPDNTVRNIDDRQFDAGFYVKQIDLSGLKPDIYRLYFKVIRGNVTYSSYGDIKVIK